MNDELQCNGLDQTGVGHDLRDTRISHPLVTKTTDSLHCGYGLPVSLLGKINYSTSAQLLETSPISNTRNADPWY